MPKANSTAANLVTFEVAVSIWGDPDVSLANDTTRACFFAVWAMAIAEMDEALDHERASRAKDRRAGLVRRVLSRLRGGQKR
ncbi:hypothetical protein AB4156_16330 [Cupriavidus sp. 2MCAB6]|uniref:hypothetical protein n=1 Tax=Cupriavidus sp. 2MCAB6 TaxID=3232981 RepID=UPI003F8E3CC8